MCTEGGISFLWMGHRAENEANEINATGSGVLNYVGRVYECACNRRVLVLIPSK